ncbi:MAG: glycosyltransferase family 2 protein [Kiritimatiellaeota bacterium]|nr:glycosyltransferase family 2 protein [Kiritimatiellota bacterium]
MKLVIVMPCYNEEQMLPTTFAVMGKILDGLIAEKLVCEQSRLCFVNDGSRDATWDMIRAETERNPRVSGISLSRNFGHQSALLAGLKSADADMVVTMDADLQDDPECIREMVTRHKQGDEIVFGVRNDKRASDTFFKKHTALFFYKLMKALGVNLVHNHVDFRLMGRRAIAALKLYDERNLFLRAVIPLLGFKSSNVYYERAGRGAGETKYPFRKMLSFAMNGISGFSVVPLRLITLLGFVTCLLSVVLSVLFLYRWFTGDVVHGWTSSMCVMLFFFGVTIMSLGIVGEYIGRIFIEVKSRPLFLIDEQINL